MVRAGLGAALALFDPLAAVAGIADHGPAPALVLFRLIDRVDRSLGARRSDGSTVRLRDQRWQRSDPRHRLLPKGNRSRVRRPVQSREETPKEGSDNAKALPLTLCKQKRPTRRSVSGVDLSGVFGSIYMGTIQQCEDLFKILLCPLRARNKCKSPARCRRGLNSVSMLRQMRDPQFWDGLALVRVRMVEGLLLPPQRG
jgi:hypothetical protein